MHVRPEQVVDLVKHRKDAQKVIAELIMKFSTDAAFTRLWNAGSTAHQSATEMAKRTAGNVLGSMVVRKPGGFVG